MDASVVSGGAGATLQGIKDTLLLVSLSFSLGLLLAPPLAVLETSGHPAARKVVRAFVWFCRKTPLLLQMLLLYFGLGQVEAMKETFLWPMFKELYFCALFVFCLTTCAHTTAILAGAIRATPYDAIAAARLLGMSTLQILRKIVLPHGLRWISISSREMLFLLHGAVLTSVITLFDLTGAGEIATFLSARPFLTVLSAVAFYLTIILSIALAAGMLKRHWHTLFPPLAERTTELEASP